MLLLDNQLLLVRLLVTGTTANNNFTTAEAHQLVPHAFDNSGETITWESLCTYTANTIGGMNNDGTPRAGISPIAATINMVSVEIASLTGPIINAANRKINAS